MSDVDESQETRQALHNKSGALLMIDKKERRLVKEILSITLKSKSSRDWIVKKLGKEYLDIGEKLLETMGGTL